MAASDAISVSTTAASSTAACAFERHVRRVHASGSHAKAPCVLDICPALGTHFAIGSLDLVQADLQAACNSEVAATILDSLAAAGLTRIFGLRTEIVNFKKALLHVVGDVQKLERSMVRQASFFASESPRCKIEGHDCELDQRLTSPIATGSDESHSSPSPSFGERAQPSLFSPSPRFGERGSGGEGVRPDMVASGSVVC